ncbi:hypothetical protein EON65_17070 [archaeon]|nr:MAG: hypothetical protein EON65_17070 [archaeon]
MCSQILHFQDDYANFIVYVQVHSYGRCKHNREEPDLPDDPNWPPIAQRRARKISVLSNYYFYLAFENLAIDDYVSEKVFEGLVAGTVPVYRGASTIHKFMPSNDSYIDANSLSPKQLADRLKAIAASPEEYDKYMQFKSRPLTEDFRKITEMSYVHPQVVQRICAYAQKKDKK